ncbi:hypothetical protein [Muriicola soli]|uniref:STAS/SEC14 domain-containing protein n=1 Tax=Muriicola soli TaxID=2507538 RepID=A0A411EAL4_9FLAO|nr:hypothetical protein [Muriicola soli]QBA64765.1 hypothetical protein EQY75_09640 [Muriicola soli]
MPNKIEHTVYPEYIEITMYGTILPSVEKAEALQRWSKILDLCKKENRKKVLAVSHFEGVYQIDTSFNLVENAGKLGWDHSYKLALVVEDKERFLRLMFIETAMIQYGYEMKLFDKKRAAIKWLLE